MTNKPHPTLTVRFYRSGKTGDWYWQMKRRGRQVVADSAEGYKRHVDCVRAFNNLVQTFVQGLFVVEDEKK